MNCRYRAIVFDRSNHEISIQDGKLLIDSKSAGKDGKKEELASIQLSDVNSLSIIEAEREEYKNFNRNKKYLYAGAAVVFAGGLSGYITGIVKDNFAIAFSSYFGSAAIVLLLLFAMQKMEEKCFKEHGLSVSKDNGADINIDPIKEFIDTEKTEDRKRNKDKKQEVKGGDQQTNLDEQILSTSAGQEEEDIDFTTDEKNNNAGKLTLKSNSETLDDFQKSKLTKISSYKSVGTNDTKRVRVQTDNSNKSQSISLAAAR